MSTVIRRTLLQRAFNLLYSRFSWLHEAAGWVLFGAAWHARRIKLIPDTQSLGPVLDIGCGEGRLLKVMKARNIPAFGIDASPEMCRRARSSGAVVCRGDSRRMPLKNGCVSTVVCSYPGPWIMHPETWEALSRVVAAGGTVAVLLGGTYESGRGGAIRRFLARVTYGAAGNEAPLPSLGHPTITGDWRVEHDRWGRYFIWRGLRCDSVGGV